MDLYKEILAHALAHEPITIIVPGLEVNTTEIVEGVCYKALKQIKEVIGNGALDDAECFEKIEKIVRELEQIGSGGDGRHDFG